MHEAAVRLVGRLALVEWALTGVLNAQARGDDEELTAGVLGLRLQEHPTQRGINGQAGQITAQGRQLTLLIEGSQFLQHRVAPANGHRGRRIEEREGLDVAEARGLHAQNHLSQVGPLDFGLGKRAARFEVLLGIQPDANTGLDTTRPSFALVGAALRHRFDREPPRTGAGIVAAHPDQTGVDDEADARNGERGLGNVGGDDHLATGRRTENLLLIAGTQPPEERNHLRFGAQSPLDQVRTFADVAFTGQEDEHVTCAGLIEETLTLTGGRVDKIGVGRIRRGTLAPRGPILDLYRERTARNFDDWRVVESLREGRGVDGGRGDDDLQVGALSQEVLEVPQQEVDVQRTLMSLVDDDGLVFGQRRITLHLGQQHTVGHQLDDRIAARPVVEADLATHLAAPGHVQFFGDASRDGQRGHATGLGATNHGPGPKSGLQAHLGDLGRLARSGLTGNDHHRMGADRGHNVILASRDGQPGRVLRTRHRLRPKFTAFNGTPRLFHKPIQRMRAFAYRPTFPDPSGRARAQPNPVRKHAARQQLPEFIYARVGHAIGAQSMRQARPVATPGMISSRGIGGINRFEGKSRCNRSKRGEALEKSTPRLSGLRKQPANRGYPHPSPVEGPIQQPTPHHAPQIQSHLRHRSAWQAARVALHHRRPGHL